MPTEALFLVKGRCSKSLVANIRCFLDINKTFVVFLMKKTFIYPKACE